MSLVFSGYAEYLDGMINEPRRTARDQRAAAHGANRSLALGLLAVALVFLFAAVGVVLLVRHGPF